METIVIAAVPKGRHFAQFKALVKKYSALLKSKDALKLPPHFTIVSRFKTNAYYRLLRAVCAYCKNLQPFTAEFDSVGYFEEPPVLVFHVKLTPQIKKIHEQLLYLIQRYREPWAREELRPHVVSPKQQRLVKQYGSPFVKDFYSPHLTLAGADVDKKQFQKLVAAPILEKRITLVVNSIQFLRKTEDGWIIDQDIPVLKIKKIRT